MKSPPRKLLILGWIHAVYYATSGIWPVLDIDSFMAITGEKQDIWLVRTVGLLLAATGAAVGWATQRKSLPVEVVFLAVLQAAILAGVDLFYAGIGRISPIYRADAIAELVLIAGWLAWYPWRRELAATRSAG